MINLLPPDLKSNYRYGRRNVGLRRWVFSLVIALVGLAAISTFGLLALHQSTKSYAKQVSASEAYLEKGQYTQTQKRVEDISSSFKLAVQVLGKEILFSELLKQISTIIPANANLTGLTISQTQGAIDITAVATDYSTASQVQVNLADPDNKIFSKADIISITCSASAAGTTSTGAVIDTRYPCTVTIRALFASNNPFLFINSKGTAATP